MTHQIQGYSIRLKADFSSETLEARTQWDDIVKVLKGGEKLPIKNSISGQTIHQKMNLKKTLLNKNRHQNLLLAIPPYKEY